MKTGEKITTRNDLSVIIVNFNTRDLLDQCLASVFASKLRKYKVEVIISDNGSRDGSLEMVRRKYPRVILFSNNANLGFAKANNIAIRKSTGRYILLLNSDTIVPPNTLEGMIRFMDRNSQIGLSTCRLELADGSIDPACHRGFPTPLNALFYLTGLEKLFPGVKLFSGYHQWYKDLSAVHRIDCPSGAFFLVSRKVIDKVGLLDEDYFMYGEDIDWAYRIKNSGFEVWYNPEFKIIHLKKKSGRANINRERKKQTDIMFHTNNRKFYTKHYARIYPPYINLLVYLFYSLRLYLVKTFAI